MFCPLGNATSNFQRVTPCAPTGDQSPREVRIFDMIVLGFTDDVLQNLTARVLGRQNLGA